MKTLDLSRQQLKHIAMGTMLLDHMGYLLFPQVLWLRYVGRLAFPIYTFFLAQGFAHTKSRARYLARLVLFAVISEVPFDWLIAGRGVWWGGQNVLWTLALGLLALWCLERSTGTPVWFLGAAACVWVAELAQTDYGAFGVGLCVLFHVLWKGRWRVLLCGLGFLLLCFCWPFAPIPGTCIPMEVFGLGAIVLLGLYRGRGGGDSRVGKYGVYLFYPAHMALLVLIGDLF